MKVRFPDGFGVKHGHWSDVIYDVDGEYVICSCCGNDADISHYGEPYPYCPNCGAKMDEVIE